MAATWGSHFIGLSSADRELLMWTLKAKNAQDSWHRFLTLVGQYATADQIQKVRSAANYLETGRWLRARGFKCSPRYRSRFEFHAGIARPFVDVATVYLEFGVWTGDSLRTWLSLLRNPASKFHGFDSFEGLPEDWNAGLRKGAFSLKGAVPQFEDPRLTLHKGWFADVLPGFRIPSHNQLIIHLDADLYSSTACVLHALQGEIYLGTILMFDEFVDPAHELRAFDEYLERSHQRFEFIGGTEALEQAAFRRIA